MTAVETDGLTKRYGDTVAVNSLSLTVEEGSVFGFLGPNGAGKTTTIDMLLGYTQPTEGGATVLGAEPSDAPNRRYIGVLPEDFGVYRRLTGREHIEFAAESKDVEEDIDSLLERVGLSDAGDERADGYSKGMRKRLLLATALVGDPDLLILDEPTSGLDPNGARRVREIVQEESQRGATIFFSSHILGQVEAVCDSVGIMRDGEMAATDTIEALRDRIESSSELTLSVESSEEAMDAVSGLNGVSKVEMENGSVRISCLRPETKIEAFDAVREVTDVTDFSTEEMSLDDVFAEVTEE